MKFGKEDEPLSLEEDSPRRRSIGCGTIFGLSLALLCLGGFLYWYSASDGQKDAHLNDVKGIAKRFLSFLYTETSQSFINSPPAIPPIGESMRTQSKGEQKAQKPVVGTLPVVEKPKPSEAQVLALHVVDSYENARLNLDASVLSLLQHIPSPEEGKNFYMAQVDAFLQYLDEDLLSEERKLRAKEVQGFYKQLSQKTKQVATILEQMAHSTDLIAHLCSIEQGKYSEDLVEARLAYEKCKKEGVTGDALEEAEARYSIADGKEKAAQASREKVKRELFARLQRNGFEEGTLLALVEWAGKCQQSRECLIVASLALKDFSARLLRKDHAASLEDPFHEMGQTLGILSQQQENQDGLETPPQQLAKPIPIIPRQEALTPEEQLLFDPEIRR